MKTFLEITKQIARQPWSIEDPDFTNIEVLLEDSPKLVNATQKANSFLFRTYDFSFKSKEKSYNTISGIQNYDAPSGNIKTVFCKGNTDPLIFDTYISRLRDYNGRPTRYNRLYESSQDIICLHPIPNDKYSITVIYDTLKAAQRLEDNKYIEVDNLEADNDILNVPQQYEDIYLQALYSKAMVYLIQDNSDENYLPYENSFKEAVNVLLKNTRGITGATRFVI